MIKLISIDVETTKLWKGQPIAISAVDIDGVLFEGRVAEVSEWPDLWVKENVWPHCQCIRNRYETYAKLVEGFSDWWLDVQLSDSEGELVVIAHCPNPVETGLFRMLAEENYFAYSMSKIDMLSTYNQFEPKSPKASPLCIHDVGTLLLINGENPNSVDSFLKSHGVTPPNGEPHNPRYDAIAAIMAWQILQPDGREHYPDFRKLRHFDYWDGWKLMRCIGYDPINELPQFISL